MKYFILVSHCIFFIIAGGAIAITQSFFTVYIFLMAWAVGLYFSAKEKIGYFSKYDPIDDENQNIHQGLFMIHIVANLCLLLAFIVKASQAM